jgi:hypothetical protein
MGQELNLETPEHQAGMRATKLHHSVKLYQLHLFCDLEESHLNWKVAVVACFKASSYYLPGMTENRNQRQ